MTLSELHQKLAVDKLMETGVGLVSVKTYGEIAALFQPGPEYFVPPDMTVAGIRLIQNPFIPDGEIWPFEKWDFGRGRKTEFSKP